MTPSIAVRVGEHGALWECLNCHTGGLVVGPWHLTERRARNDAAAHQCPNT